MKANNIFKNMGSEFWATVKLLNQRLGYHERKSKKNPDPNFMVPSEEQVIQVFSKENLNSSQLVNDEGKYTKYGQQLKDYFEYRKNVLNKEIEPSLMDAKGAKKLFYEQKKKLNPSCPLPLNKQKGDKKGIAFLTGLVHMLLEANSKDYTINYDPMELTAITQNNFPVQTFSRRVDGAFPSVINPIAIWEIKEYYYTTTFGSRVADGVYETMLDGYEVRDAKNNFGFNIKHYLIIDAHYTWWKLGKSYLCRIIDMLHMGLLDEVIVGKQAVTRIPKLMKEWILDLEKRNKNK